MNRDGIPLEDRDIELLDVCLQHPDTHQDTLASYVPKLLDKIERLQRGGATLGKQIDDQLRDVVRVTQSEALIDADGDGDWMLVWERLYEMRQPARSLRTVDDLKALPRRSIVLDKDDITYRLAPWRTEDSTWYPFDGWDAFHRDFGVDVDDIALPATLLHEGEK